MIMDFLSIAQNRYTTKKYDSSKHVSDEDINKLKEILRLSPSSIDSQPWKFTIISDQELKNKLAEASFWNEHRIKDASHLVVFNVVDNLEVFEKQIQQHLPEANVGYYNTMIKQNPEESIKSWLAHQVYISLGYFLSACASMGIDSTPMEGVDIKEYTKILGMKDYKPLFAVSIGYRDEKDENQPAITPKSRLDLKDVIESI